MLAAGDAKFVDVITYIENRYNHIPTGFMNGAQYNSASENQGSAKVLYFAKLTDLNQQDTLRLFAEHYDAVCIDPDGDNHQNIRQFMLNGWEGVSFDGEALVSK